MSHPQEMLRPLEKGQSLLEFVIALPPLTLVVTACFGFLHSAFQRTECARLVFEAVRSAQESDHSFISSNGVFLKRSEDGISGWKRCGKRVERLFLPKIGKRKTHLSSSEDGAISPALLLLTFILASASISVLTYAMNWRKTVSLQLRLDRCVESKSLLFTRLQNRIEASNSRMRAERAAAIAASIPSGGSALSAVRGILSAERAFQESLRIRWSAEEAKWILRRGCDDRGDYFLPLPKMDWWRPPDDLLGPRPLERRPGKLPPRIRIWKKNRASQSTLLRSPPSSPFGKGTWSARWSGKEDWANVASR